MIPTRIPAGLISSPAMGPAARAQATAPSSPGGAGLSGPVPTDWQSHLPGPLKYVGLEITNTASRVWDDTWNFFDRSSPKPPAKASDPRSRAKAALTALQRNLGSSGGEFGDNVKQRWRPTSVWPLGQAIAGELDVAALTGNYQSARSTISALGLYRQGQAYAPGVTFGVRQNRYFDDNEWIGLDMMQAYDQSGNKAYLQRAEGIFDFLQTGQTPSGGEHWVENANRPTRNTCSNAPGIELALRLYQATKDPKYLDFARRSDAFLERTLRSPSGLYWDNVSDSGQMGKYFWSYNQGTPIGADVLFYKLTGDKSYLARATQTAKAALAHYAKDDRLWKQPPCFNAIFFRNLLQLDQVAPDPSYRKALDTYLERAWTTARDPKTGLFDRGGIGHYGTPGNTLDQGGMIQLFALQAMTPQELSQIT